MSYVDLVRKLQQTALAAPGYAPLMQDAADAIEELSDWWKKYEALAEMVQMPRWISVKERLPEPYSWVLGFGFGETEMPIEVFYDGSEWKDSVLGGWYITHWMPLPAPPKEDEA